MSIFGTDHPQESTREVGKGREMRLCSLIKVCKGRDDRLALDGVVCLTLLVRTFGRFDVFYLMGS